MLPQDQTLHIALVGTPNAGKTALFNTLTASHQRVANYSGVTVESAEADFYLPSGTRATLVDLPGAYSLRPYTDDEGVLAHALKQNNFDALVIVVDATQPERAIRFLVEVLDATDRPAVVALNMADLAQARGFELDLKKLSARLGVPVISTVAVKKQGMLELPEAIESAMDSRRRVKGALLGKKKEHLTPKEVSHEILAFYKKADEILKEVLKKKGRPDTQSARIDYFVLHPVWGLFILMLMLGITFQLMFNLADYPMKFISQSFDSMGNYINAMHELPEMLRSFLADGVIAGVGGTLVFLPQIIILFSLILFLEDFGFMSRAVFLMDYWMGKVGLHGRAFLPLLSSYACNIPGILATRAIETRRDRIITTMIIPLTTCSARVPVYTLLIAAFIPNTNVFLGIKLQGLVMLGLYAVGALSAFIAGAVFQKFFLRGKRPPLLIELPSYKWPSLLSLGKGLVYRAELFVKRVGTVILALTVLIWVLVSFPKAPEGAPHPVEYSFAAKLGHAIEPVMRPLGFDWKISMAMIPTFAAREVMISALSTVYAVDDVDKSKKEEKLSELIKREWSLATGLSLLVWFIFAPQCISTLATVKRELQSNKWVVIMVSYLFVLAYAAAFLTHTIVTAIMGK